MILRVCVDNETLLELAVDDEFLAWLRPRALDATLRALDPYRDSTLQRETLLRWRDDLARIAEDRRTQIESELASTRRLPRHAADREALLGQWVESALAGDEHYRTILALESVVALALTRGGLVHARGD